MSRDRWPLIGVVAAALVIGFLAVAPDLDVPTIGLVGLGIGITVAAFVVGFLAVPVWLRCVPPGIVAVVYLVVVLNALGEEGDENQAGLAIGTGLIAVGFTAGVVGAGWLMRRAFDRLTQRDAPPTGTRPS